MFTLLEIAVLILVNAVFVAAEFASVSVPVVRIEQMADEGNALARMLLPHIHNAVSLRRYVGACQIGITASSLVLGASGQESIAVKFSELLIQSGLLSPATALTVGTVATLIILTTLQVVLGELVPKAVAMRYPEKVAMFLSPVLIGSQWMFSFPIGILDFTARMILKLVRVELHSDRHVHSPEEIELLIIQGHEKGELEDEEHRRMVRVLKFGERQVREVMVPRTRVKMLPRTASEDDIVSMMARSPYTRVPVYGQSADDIVGIIHSKDVAILMSEGRPIRVDKLLRVLPAVPFAMKCDDVLQVLRRSRAWMAIVHDEYGGTAGIVTMENLFEEVLGDVQDEFDNETPSIQKISDREWIVRGDVSLADLEEEIELEFEEEDVATIGGLVMKLLGRSPQTADRVEGEGLSMEIVEARAHRVHLVRLRMLEGPK